MTLIGKLHSFEYAPPQMIPGVNVCYTCGDSAKHLILVSLQEDGPRQTMVCLSCRDKIDSGEIKRGPEQLSDLKDSEPEPRKKQHPRDLGALFNHEEITENMMGENGSVYDMKTEHDEWGYTRIYSRAWKLVAGPPEGPPDGEKPGGYTRVGATGSRLVP